LKGLQKVNGEMNLIMFCYNLMRTKNILGFKKMLKAIQNWIPDYDKVTCVLKIALSNAILSRNGHGSFLNIRSKYFQRQLKKARRSARQNHIGYFLCEREFSHSLTTRALRCWGILLPSAPANR
jgi:hypothetical protein